MEAKLIRESGLPIDYDKLDQYKAVWGTYFDKIFTKYKDDMKTCTEKTDKLSAILNKRFETVRDITLLVDSENMIKFLEEHGNIMLARHEKINELVAVIQDQNDMSQG